MIRYQLVTGSGWKKKNQRLNWLNSTDLRRNINKWHAHAACPFDVFHVPSAHPGDSTAVGQPGDRDGLW